MSTPQSSQRTSLADALFAGTRQKVLRILFMHPEETFSIAELIDQAGAGSGAVQREVGRLVDSGLVIMTMDRRKKRYAANQNAPIYPELASLVAKTLGPAQQIENALGSISGQIDLALIYGSIASNSDHANSDIDLMIVSDDLTLEEVFAALEAVEADLARPINPTLYKREEFERRRSDNNPFLRKVLDGKYILLKGIIDEQAGIGQPGQNSQTSH